MKELGAPFSETKRGTRLISVDYGGWRESSMKFVRGEFEDGIFFSLGRDGYH